MTAQRKKAEIETLVSSVPDLTHLVHRLTIIGRSLGALALRFAPSRPKTVGDRSRFLKSLGFSYNEIAGILGTTPKTVSVRLAEGHPRRPRKKKARGKD